MDKGAITLYLDKDDLDRLSKIAEEQDTSASRILRGLIRDYLAKYRKLPEGRKKAKS